LLLVVAAVTIIVIDAMPLWFGIIAGLRELLIIIGGIILATKGIRGLEVEYIGKAGAFFLMFSLPLFLLAHSGIEWDTAALVAAWVFGIPGIILNYVSAYHYYRRGRIVLAGGKDDYVETVHTQ
jgi:phosphatidylglycerophosphate synthase